MAGMGNSTVSAFADVADGTLAPIGSSPFANNQTAPCWVEISHDGQYLFAVNTAVSSVSSYSIGTDGSLTLLGNTTLNSPSAAFPRTLASHPTARRSGSSTLAPTRSAASASPEALWPSLAPRRHPARPARPRPASL
jgi:6-phosphogluconolactonase (cycloisomerase 2 family)